VFGYARLVLVDGLIVANNQHPHDLDVLHMFFLLLQLFYKELDHFFGDSVLEYLPVVINEFCESGLRLDVIGLIGLD
jgi:hypothetical protein